MTTLDYTKQLMVLLDNRIKEVKQHHCAEDSWASECKMHHLQGLMDAQLIIVLSILPEKIIKLDEND